MGQEHAKNDRIEYCVTDQGVLSHTKRVSRKGRRSEQTKLFKVVATPAKSVFHIQNLHQTPDVFKFIDEYID